MCVEHETRKERFFIDFNHVFCFCGILRWKGVGLRLGSDEEYLQFIQLMMPMWGKPYKDFLDPNYYGKLYIFDGDIGPVKLIATAHRKVDHLLKDIAL